jgi:hypothetical protein
MGSVAAAAPGFGTPELHCGISGGLGEFFGRNDEFGQSATIAEVRPVADHTGADGFPSRFKTVFALPSQRAGTNNQGKLGSLQRGPAFNPRVNSMEILLVRQPNLT